MRAMLLEFPDDPGAETLDRQYILGEALLVAPIFRDDGQATFYLPRGRWTHLLSNEEVAGDGWRVEKHDAFNLPLYVRANTLLAFGNVADRPDYDYVEGTTYQVYALEEGKVARCAVVSRDGATVGQVSARRAGSRISLSTEGIEAASFLLVGAQSATAADDESVVSPTPQGILIHSKGRTEITLA